MGATWRINCPFGRSVGRTDGRPPLLPTPLFVRSSLGPCTRHNMCVCVRVCVRVRVTSAHRTRVMGARTPPIRDFSVVKARLISTHPIRDVRSRGSFPSSPAHDARRRGRTRHDTTTMSTVMNIQCGVKVRATRPIACVRARTRRRRRVRDVAHERRSRGWIGAVGGLGADAWMRWDSHHAREAERASRDARRDARDGDGCVIFFNIVYARVMGCVY